MGINVKQKGASGEREIADIMNYIIYSVMKELGYAEDECLKGMSTVQRNQLQSAVGGDDLTGTMGLSIEVKRQESLSVNTWWAQCVKSAERTGSVPVLMFRQNGKAWRVVTYVWVPLQGGKQMQARAEFDIDTFKQWFRSWVLLQFSS